MKPTPSLMIVFALTALSTGCGDRSGGPPVDGRDGTVVAGERVAIHVGLQLQRRQRWRGPSCRPYPRQRSVLRHDELFSIDSEGREHVVYRFKGPPDEFNPTAPPLFINGNLYGTTTEGGAVISGGSVFQLGLSGQESVIASFLIQPWYPGPTAGLTYMNGNFYGTTEYSYNGSASAPGDGSVFKLSPSGKLTVLHVFKGDVDGRIRKERSST